MQQSEGYGATAKLLHWLIVALLLSQYALGWLMPDVPRGAAPGGWTNLHFSLGAGILGLMLLRLVWRLTHPVAPAPGLSAWQRRSAEGLHLLLYLLVILTTTAGWAAASWSGWTVTLFGLVSLPPLGAKGSAFAGGFGALHFKLIWVLLATLGTHMAAALTHLFVYRDRVMQRMLPGVR